MPISRKRFSKKRISKKLVRKNTRKYKKRTHRRKHRKSGKRVRFFGGFGEDGECSICFEPLTNGKPIFTTNCQHNFHRGCIEDWCNGKAVCPCPLCKTPLDPNPNPNPNPNPVVAEEMENLYRVQFFRFVNNPQTGEIDRVPVSVNNTSDTDMVILTDYFIDQIPETNDNNFLFFGDEAGTNPYGYIQLYDGQDDVVINEGDMDINTDPPIDIQSVTITRVPNFNT